MRTSNASQTLSCNQVNLKARTKEMLTTSVSKRCIIARCGAQNITYIRCKHTVLPATKQASRMRNDAKIYLACWNNAFPGLSAPEGYVKPLNKDLGRSIGAYSKARSQSSALDTSCRARVSVGFRNLDAAAGGFATFREPGCFWTAALRIVRILKEGSFVRIQVCPMSTKTVGVYFAR